MSILFTSSFSPHFAILSAFVAALALAQDSQRGDSHRSKLDNNNHTHRHIRQGHSNALAFGTGGHPQDSFSLNCPHVTDANNNEVKIEVTWTKDDTIWLKIENGEKKIYNKLTSFDRKRIGNKTVLRVTLNKGRYVFGYDELTGDFVMEIRPINEEDTGLWQCHVTVYQKGDIHTLTSRSRVKGAHQSTKGTSIDGRGHAARSGSKYSASQADFVDRQGPISSFIRPDQSTIEINRDRSEKKVIVFARQSSPSGDSSPASGDASSKMAMVEYDDEGDYALSGRTNRKRHRASPDSAAAHTTQLMLITALCTALAR